MILIQDLHKSYRQGERALPVVRGVELSIGDGEMLAIMGASGSGKSTLLNIIGCLDRCDRGRYWLSGETVHDSDDDRLAELRARLIGFVFQSFNLLARRSALDNVALPLLYQGVARRDREARARTALQRVGLGDWAAHRPSQLSGGQQQRVAIARALVNRPRLLIADEPTGALDSRSSEQVMALFGELHEQGNTLVVVTHDRSVANYADRIVELRDGRLAC